MAFAGVFAGTAAAQAAGDTAVIEVKPVVIDTASIVWAENRVVYDVENVMGHDVHSGRSQTARFMVEATADYTVQVEFPTWQPGGTAPGGFEFGMFDSGDTRLSGTLFLDPTPESGPGRSDLIRQDGRGKLVATGPEGRWVWGIGADIHAAFNDAPKGIPLPGRYSIDTVVTVSTK